MKRSLISILGGVIFAFLVILCVLAVRRKDSVAPEITIPKTEVTYTEGDSYEVLLQGVTAKDDRDGDVTDAIIVDRVLPLTQSNKAVVTYVTRDTQNNICRVERTVNYVAKSDCKEEAGDSLTVPPGTEITPSKEPTAEPTEKPPVEPTAEPTAEPTVEPTPEVLKYPYIRLKQTEVTISKGDEFKPLSYIDECVDDKDDVARRVNIVGDYDRNKAGTYTITYFTSDLDGNKSEDVTLTLIVTE